MAELIARTARGKVNKLLGCRVGTALQIRSDALQIMWRCNFTHFCLKCHKGYCIDRGGNIIRAQNDDPMIEHTSDHENAVITNHQMYTRTQDWVEGETPNNIGVDVQTISP
jgi:hypothetical protein